MHRLLNARKIAAKRVEAVSAISTTSVKLQNTLNKRWDEYSMATRFRPGTALPGITQTQQGITLNVGQNQGKEAHHNHILQECKRHATKFRNSTHCTLSL